MKYYAGLDLYQIDIDTLNTQNVQRIQEAFMAHNGYISNYKALCNRSDNVIKHLSNYFKLTLACPLTPTQAIAYTLKFMPMECAQTSGDNRYIYLKYLQQALKGNDYANMELAEREELIRKNKSLLNIKKNWAESAEQFFEAAVQQNLATTYGFLKQIDDMDKNLPPKTTTNKYRACILSMQLMNYLNVAMYMRKIILGGLYAFATPELATLYEKVDNALQETLQKLIELPEVEPKPSALARLGLDGMFFSCIPRKICVENSHSKKRATASKHFSYLS